MMRLLGILLAGALLALSVGSGALAAHKAPSVTPAEGVPGMTFTFTAAGFFGALPADETTSAGEEIAYWANLPDGRVLSTEPRSAANDYGHETKPLLAKANGHGEMSIRWVAPRDAIPGAYTMVFHGRESGYEVVIPFTIHPNGWQTVVQTNVTPKAGKPGTEFVFIATGYEGAGVDVRQADSRGEDVSYWFNTPDGAVIASESRSDESDYGSAEKPLLHFADANGTASIFWTAPEGLRPGTYSIVIHGLYSQHEVKIFFTIL